MNNIKDIKKLRNNTYIITITKNNKDNTHIISEDTIIKYDLLKPRKLTNEEYNKIIKDNEYSLLLGKALHFIDYQMRSISETKKHLRKSTKDEKLIDKIIKELKDLKYLNDNNFVKEFVNEKINFDSIGPKSIKEKLIGKGIHFDLIDDHLIKYTDNIQYSKIEDIIKKETKYPIKKPYNKAVISIKTKLANKGFSLNIIDSSIQSYGYLIKEACLEENILEKELSKLLKDYDINNYEQKQKLISKLLQKGFDYNLIKKHI